MSRLLTPAVEPPPLGHASYALPAFPNGAQAALLYPTRPAESQETTVYGRASATLGVHRTTMPHAATIGPSTRVRLGGIDVVLVISALRRRAAYVAPRDQDFYAILSIPTTDNRPSSSTFLRYLRETSWHMCASRAARDLTSAGGESLSAGHLAQYSGAH
jgi:hypothetical protein